MVSLTERQLANLYGENVELQPDKPPATLYIVARSEPVWKSWLRDAATFGGLLGTAIGLNTLMPPSGWLNAALAIAWFLWMLGRAHRLRVQMTPEQARAWLDAHHPTTPERTAA